MALQMAVQRLEIGDVIRIASPEQESEVEATVVRALDRTERAVRVTVRVEGRELVKEWPLDEMVTVVRGP
jgi:hypothetical protein